MTRRIICSFISFLLLHCKIFSQQKIGGPSCVKAGVTYQYNVSVNNNGIDPVEVCVIGGRINGTQVCATQTTISVVRIVWNENFITGSIRIKYQNHIDSIAVYEAKDLDAGSIEATSKVQLTTDILLPQSIKCGLPSYGNCSPSYNYQWEQSTDAQLWTPIASAVSKDLSFAGNLFRTTLFRRRTKEIKSGTISYSDIATIVIATTSSITNSTTGSQN